MEAILKRPIQVLAFLVGAILAYFLHASVGGRYHTHSGFRIDGMTGKVTSASADLRTIAEFR